MTEDQVVRCKMKSPFDLLAPTNELDFLDLCCISLFPLIHIVTTLAILVLSIAMMAELRCVGLLLYA